MKWAVNYKRLVIWLTPIVLRRPVLITWLQTLISPIEMLHRLFDRYRADTDYRLEHNGQTCHLRGVLNDYFDAEQRRITITDAEIKRSTTIYMRSESMPTMVPKRPGAEIISRRGFGGADGYDFTINIPRELIGAIDMTQLRALTDHYKLTSKRYTISYYE